MVVVHPRLKDILVVLIIVCRYTSYCQKMSCPTGVSNWVSRGTASEQLETARRDLMEITLTISMSCQKVLEKLERSKVITKHTCANKGLFTLNDCDITS